MCLRSMRQKSRGVGLWSQRKGARVNLVDPLYHFLRPNPCEAKLPVAMRGRSEIGSSLSAAWFPCQASESTLPVSLTILNPRS
jgi:hypothetical protein